MTFCSIQQVIRPLNDVYLHLGPIVWLLVIIVGIDELSNGFCQLRRDFQQQLQY